MVGIEGQYLFFFTVGNLKDFIQEGNLVNFKLCEYVGNFLPMFQLEFQSIDDTFSKYLNEGNTFKVSFGKDNNNLTESTLIVTKLRCTKVGDHIVNYKVTGLYNAMPYLTNTKLKVISKKSSIDAISSIAKANNFEMDLTGISTQDSMAWVQHNMTDRNMVNKIWMHSYIPSSMMAIGITTDGKMRVRDLKKLASNPEDYKWKFTNREDKPKEIPYDTYFMKSSTGMTNFTFGYGRKKLVNDLESGLMHVEDEDPFKPFLALAPDLNRSKDVTKREDEHAAMSSDNVHKFYHKCYLQNVINLSVFGAVKIKLNFKNMFRKVNVLDLVYFKENITASNKDDSSEYTTGLWIVSKVGLLLENRKLTTFVDIVRETPNSIRGDLR